MIQKTTLAGHIDAADTKTQLDYACTKLISNKIILAHIMKGTLEEYSDCDVREIAEKYIEGDPVIAQRTVHQDLTGQVDDPVDSTLDNLNSSIRGDNTVDKSIQEGTVVFDIRFRALAPKGGEVITLILNVELQKNFYPGYPLVKRAIYYCARMISAQYGTEFTKSDYKQLKKVYSIWICFKPPKEHEHSIVKYQMVEQTLQGKSYESVEDYDLISVVMIYLGPVDRQRIEEKNVTITDLLSLLFSSEIDLWEKKRLLEQCFGIEMTDKLDEEVEDMCNFSDVYMEEGLARGMAQGLAKGLADGEEKMAKLISLLLAEGNNEVLLQVLEDKVAREKCYRQYSI